MPKKGKRNKSAKNRELKKKLRDETATAEINATKSNSLVESSCALPEYHVVSGTFHQGSDQFQYPGIQCTYISFFALIKAYDKHPSTWGSDDVDNCLYRGNEGFLDHFGTLGKEPEMLLVNELPQTITLGKWMYNCQQCDSNIKAGVIFDRNEPRAISDNTLSYCLDDAIVECFDLANAALFVFAHQTISILRIGNDFFLFDSHSRNRNGFQSADGSAVLISFSEIKDLIKFIKTLCIDSRKIKLPEPFELVPIILSRHQLDISKSLQEESMRLYMADQHTRNEEHKELRRSLQSENPSEKLKFDRASYIKAYMRMRRKNNDLKIREQEFDVHRKRMQRKDDKYRQEERNKDAKSKCLKRKSEAFSVKEHEYDVHRKRKRRKDEKYRLEEREKDAKVKSLKRQSEAFLIKKREFDVHWKRNQRKDENYRLEEKEKDAKYKSLKRKTEAFLIKEHEFDVQRKRKSRKNKDFRELERQKDAKGKSLKRQKSTFKAKENQYDLIRKRVRRADQKYRQAEKKLDAIRKSLTRRSTPLSRELADKDCNRKRLRRKDKSFKEAERLCKQAKRRIIRLNARKNQIEASRTKKRRLNLRYRKKEMLQRKSRKFGTSFQEGIDNFNTAIVGCCSYVCSCCQQLWFRQSMRETSSLKKLDKSLVKKCLTNLTSFDDKEWICSTCLYNIRKGNIPKLSLENGMSFPEKPPELELCNLEERLIALRIPFMQIRCLASGGQYSLKGSVVNVPAQIEPAIRALPRPRNNTETIPVKLKRMISMKHAVTTENIRPHAVMLALKKLLTISELYKEANISIDERWNDKVLTELDTPEDSVKDSSGDESDAFSEAGDANDIAVMTLLDEPEVNKDNVLSVAPGEGQRPISLFKDSNAEYLAFPTIYCGQRRIENSQRHVKVYYSDICKWELRSVDRRVALHVPNLFFKMKKLQLEQVSNKVHLAIRRCKTKGKTYTAGYILKDNMGESLIKLDEGYNIFRIIRNSPQYWESQKKDVFAMIRQLGLPSLFISLSANDLNWPELIIALGKLVDEKDYTREVDNKSLSWETRSRLVQSDPVTCVRHFQHRVSQFIATVLQHPNCPLGKLQDYFYRVEFQQRGSPHIHMLLWISNAPQYNNGVNDEKVIDYIDNVAVCSSKVSEDDVSYLECQKHKHTRTCRKGGKSICRFGIPFPAMKETKILRPFEGEDRLKYENHYKLIQRSLNELQEDITFEKFLLNIGLSEESYLKAVETSIKTPKVFLKRKPIETRINPYMKDLLGTWKANHDIQFVLDAYACAMYIVSYISKSAKGMSELMANACKEARKDNKSLKESVRLIGNKFLNASEVSAQEAVYLILQMSLSEKSRKCEFISTAPPGDRTFLLKSKKDLSELPNESTDIEADNVIKRYARRPKALEEFCLADYVAKIVSVSELKQSTDDENSFDSHTDIDQEENIPNVKNNDFRQRYTLFRDGCKITLRRKPKVIRYVRYSEKVDPSNFYREQLMLFHPWREETSDLLNGHETYREQYLEVSSSLISNRMEYEANAKLLEAVEENLNETEVLDFENVNPSIERIEEIDRNEESISAKPFEFYFPDNPEHAIHDIGSDLGLKSHIPNDVVDLVQGRLPKQEYYALLSNLNKKQRQIFTHVMHSLTMAPSEQICLFITGGAGVGKSVVIRVLYQALHRHFCSEAGQNPEDIRIAVCAYTGLAAYNVQGSTLHSTFCIEPNKKLTYKRLSDDKQNTLRTKYRNLSVLIVDEVSMVGNGMLSFLYHRLQEIKCNYHKPFGGVHIILVGDLFQLRPVGDSWIFADSKEGYASLGTNLWRTYFTMFELTEIMRQKEDKTFAELLNRLREGNQTEDDLSVLRARRVSPESDKYKLLKQIPHLYPCNEDVDNHNEDVYEVASTAKAEIRCIDTVLGDDCDEVKRKILTGIQKSKVNDTGNLSSILKVAVDLNYDTTHNISIEDGLCNGTPCVLKKIQYFNASIPSCLWVQFSDRNVGKETRRKYRQYFTREIDSNWTPIWAVKRTFIHRNKAVVRQQFPLKQSSAKTIHKAQGQTKEEVVVDTLRGTRAHHHYVAFSRVTSIRGLHLLNGLNGKMSVDKGVLEEVRRLRGNAQLQLSFKPVSDYNSDLVLVFQNAQSLYSHFNLVRNDVTFKDADVIGFVETRFCSEDKDEQFGIDGFNNAIRNDDYQLHDKRPAHGIAMYCKRKHKVIRQKKLSNPSVESSLITIHSDHSNRPYTIIVVYKSPSCSMQIFKQHLKDLAKFELEENVVLMGDFNFDVTGGRNQSFLKEIKACFPMVEYLKTCPTTQGNTTIDLAFTSCQNATSNVLSCVWSYHNTLVLSLNP